MHKGLHTTGNIFSKTYSGGYRLNRLLLFLLAVLPFTKLQAEGSKELSANGGYRAYLYSSNAANQSFPYPTLGTMKVYVKAGETICVGSSAQGMASGTINLKAPDGSLYSSGSSTTVGLIANRSQEVAGPLPNTGGYTPYKVTVQANQEGVWEVDFISQTNGVDLGTNPPDVPANANWTQPDGIYIAAFDVSVRDAGNTQFLTGRVFTNVFSGILGTFNVGFNAILNILTNDGYQYTLNNNGQAGNGFTFFVNNKGFRTSSGAPSYESIDDLSDPDVQDPRAGDTPSDVTDKIFFNPPAVDLPVSAKTPEGTTTWLLTTPTGADVTNVNFTGTEGTLGKGGTNPLGGNFNFTSSGGGSYVILIDVNKNGSFNDPVDAKLTGTVNAGPNSVYWNGLDGQGNKVPADTNGYKANITVTTTAGEVHFPFFDVERNVNGIILTRINGPGAPDNIIYWDDSQITIVGTPPNPIVNLKGISSVINGHKWGTPTTDPNDQNDFGNNKGIDTWAYINSAPVTNQASFILQQADLEIDSISSAANCAGQPVTYTITVKNNGPDNVSGAKFQFSFPNTITNIAVSSTASTGSSFVSSDSLSATGYKTGINLANGAIRKFVITGIIDKTAIPDILTTASILRPADVTDPDATNPDAAPPTDPISECNSPPSGTGCNNVKIDTTRFEITPNAGADQTIYQYTTTTLTAVGLGTWKQASGDPAFVNIVNPSAASTEVNGFTALGVYHFVYTNNNECADTVAVTVLSDEMVIPNIFTPNGDGKNDVFKIKGLEAYPGSQLSIFNRWGNEVYHSDNYLNNWDGSNLAEGTYYYLLNRREHDGSTVPFKGWIFLKRSK
jgi:gliding motility-associated-like protein/uncharacterized repeat protein (TIGR01451 family)